MKHIALVTSGRQDWGILRSTALQLGARPDFRLSVIAGGMHLHRQFGQTIDLVRADGFRDALTLDWLGEGEIPTAARQSARALEMVAETLMRLRPRAVLLVGDRFETLAAGQAAVLARVPIVHLHGGEESEGALDNSFRHALSKLSHLHLVSHPSYRDRLIGMGESKSTIYVVGAPGLDNLHRPDLLGRLAMEGVLGGALTPPVVCVTYHPATLSPDTVAEAQALIAAMDSVPATYVVSSPNTDPESDEIRTLIERACVGRSDRFLVGGLGEQRYWSLLKLADAMLGNSSSGLIEASAVHLPVVNVGHRQRGRLRSPNVLDVPEASAASVSATLRKALDPSFRQSIQGLAPLYGDGHAADRIVPILADWTPPSPPVKMGVAP